MDAKSLRGIHLMLRLIQSGVRAFQCEQFVVGTDFGDATLLQHDNAIRFSQSADAVRDRNRRTPLNEHIQSFLNLSFCFRVHGRRRFVQNEDPRVC
jgi:hypothetical protein